MDKPKSPCMADCDYRSKNCHNESCPYGWAVYEKELKNYMGKKDAKFILDMRSDVMTIARKNRIHRNQLFRKRKNKFI